MCPFALLLWFPELWNLQHREIPDYVQPAATLQQGKPFDVCVPKFSTIIWKERKQE